MNPLALSDESHPSSDWRFRTKPSKHRSRKLSDHQLAQREALAREARGCRPARKAERAFSDADPGRRTDHRLACVSPQNRQHGAALAGGNVGVWTTHLQSAACGLPAILGPGLPGAAPSVIEL